MSNKFRNKFLIVIFAFFLTTLIFELNCFEPEAADFENLFQYNLYRSWLQKGQFKTNFPAGFSHNNIVKTFIDQNGLPIVVEYDWSDHKIIEQRESLPANFVSDDFSKIQSYLLYLEGFIYRLNTTDFIFLEQYCELDKFRLDYLDKSQEEALILLWNEYEQQRIRIEPIELEVKNEQLVFMLPLKSGNMIVISFPVDYNISAALRVVRRKEADLSSDLEPVKSIIEDDYSKFETSSLLPQVKSLPPPASLTLAEYVKLYHREKQSKELLHNKISDPFKFLSAEFPQREIKRAGNIFSILAPAYSDHFHCDISVLCEIENEAVYFRPFTKYEIIDKSIILANGEKIEAASLDESEIEMIATNISQLIFKHRAIGSRLLNFLLIHDDIPTTLVMHDDTRRVYELDSYADLLLLLGNYWQQYDIYFKVQEVTKKNGNIEFSTYLIASNVSKNQNDMAEILFLLNEQFKIDLIMMILHQDSEMQ